MSPITHFFIGWLVATPSKLTPKERAIIAFAGVMPDLDAAGIIAEVLTKNSDHPLLWWSDYHHILGHNIGFALLVTILAVIFSTHHLLTALLTFISFHLHLLGDLVGSKGPDGYQWPIPYLLPFSSSWQLVWSGQWQLNAWQNFLITGIVMIFIFFLAYKRGYSIVGIFSLSADKIFVDTLRKRFSQIH
ncbi:MAG: metal-dependent hydrolase [Acidobacteria bacterium]|nr:metal-dependent hydrolase [Acidobacteriota bacterium]